MRSKITIADVAREANVSTQTVSRVINNKGEIRPETRQMVLEVIQRLNYRPSPMARGLASSRTTTLGLVVPDIGNSFFAEVVRGAEDVARAKGYQIFLANTDQEPEREIAAVQALEDMWVDGILMCSARLPDDQLHEIMVRRQGVVLVNRELVDGAAGSVRLSEVRSAQIITNHMLARGHRKIGMLAGRPGGPAHRSRLKGFRLAMAAAGIALDECQIVACSTNPEGGYQAGQTILNAMPDIEALVCFNDLVAIGAMRACREHRRRVPDDIAVTGFGDSVLASMISPSLTTMHEPIRELGMHAARMIIAHLNNEAYEREVVIDAELTIRESAP